MEQFRKTVYVSLYVCNKDNKVSKMSHQKLKIFQIFFFFLANISPDDGCCRESAIYYF